MSPALPAAYLAFMAESGPFEGATGGLPGYIAMWRGDELAALNADFDVLRLAPGFLAFAGDGGGELLAFDAQGQVWMLPAVGLSVDQAWRVADSFDELARRFRR